VGVSCPTFSRDESARTTSVAAACVGMSRKTYEKAKAVMEDWTLPGRAADGRTAARTGDTAGTD